MKSIIAAAAVAALTLGAAVSAQAEEAKLVIDGQELVTEVAAPDDHPLDVIRSGWTFRSAETQLLQMDDFENPAFVAVEYGQDLWSTVDGSEGKSCESCHNDVSSMAGVRAAMPKWNAEAKKPWNIEMHVNNCRTTRMGADKWKWDSAEMLAVNSLVSLQSRGMPVAPDDSGEIASWRETGKELYYTRTGQLNLSCASCHEDNYDNLIRADHLSQGQTNGFPVYRLKWQGLGSLHRRFKGCVKDTRAETYAVGSDEFLALEAYLAHRGAGLSVEAPSVRN